MISTWLNNTSTSYATFARFTIDGTTYSEVANKPVDTSLNNQGFSTHKVISLDATVHTVKIQYQAQNPATAFIKDARITAVLMSDFSEADHISSEGESVTQSTTYVDKVVLSYNATARHDDITLASGYGRQESSTYGFFANLDIDGTSQGEYIFVPGSDRIYRSFMMLSKQNISPGPTTHKIQWRTNNAASNTEAFIKDAHITHFGTNSAESYGDSGHTTVDNYFSSGENTVYIWSHGLRLLSDNTTYAVAYYDGSVTGGGQKVATDSGLTPTAYGNLSSQYLLTTAPGASAGIWHAVVFDEEFLPGGGPPTNYNDAATTAGYVVEDSFEAVAAAIPEFPTVMAAITVAGFCFVIYYWMRKRQVAYVQA